METGARRYHSPRHYRLRHVPRCPHRLCGYPLPIYKAHRPLPPLQGPTAHVDWCAARYRSYDAWTDTYQPYHGPRRYCRSPYR
ncbi:BA14K family protein [Mesorhizobium australicum]